MKGSEFLRKIQNLGRMTGMKVEFVPRRGKGKTGTLHAMLKQLGIDPKDF